MMESGIEKSVEIPEEVNIELEGDYLKVSGPEGELSRDFNLLGLDLEKENDRIVIKSESSRKERKAAVGTAVSHIKNMIEGVTSLFSSELRVVYSHFPISVNVREDRVEIENFIGEEEPRVAKVVGDTEVKVKGEEIEVTGLDKEDVGQTAANIEEATQTKGRDPRVFQDGIYITKRP